MDINKALVVANVTMIISAPKLVAIGGLALLIGLPLKLMGYPQIGEAALLVTMLSGAAVILIRSRQEVNEAMEDVDG